MCKVFAKTGIFLSMVISSLMTVSWAVDLPGGPVVGNKPVKPLPNPWSQFEDNLLVGHQSIKTLIITVEFSDQPISTFASDWSSLLKGRQGDKTLQDYFLAASYGKVSMTPAEETFGKPDGVIGPFMMQDPKTMTDMLHPNLGIDHPPSFVGEDFFEQAVKAADPYIDYASFDKNSNDKIEPSELAIFIVPAGYLFNDTYGPSMGARAFIWPSEDDVVSTADWTVETIKEPVSKQIEIHKSFAVIPELSVVDETVYPTTLRVFAHEAGHFVFGLPDLYNTQGTDAGIGDFGIMGSGKGMDPTVDRFPGQTPFLPSAWSLVKLGWVEVWSDFSSRSLVSTGAAAQPSGSTELPYGRVARVDVGKLNSVSGQIECDSDSNEYFLVQYRTPEGYDRGFSALIDPDDGAEYSGVAIYHINENYSDNVNSDYRLVDVEEQFGVIGANGTRTVQSSLWAYIDEAQSLFNANSVPDSATANGGDSGVKITVGEKSTNTDGQSVIDITIDSQCDGAAFIVFWP